MVHFTTFALALSAGTLRLVWAQQLKDGFPAPMNYPGISESCERALNTTVDCPAFLQKVSIQ